MLKARVTNAFSKSTNALIKSLHYALVTVLSQLVPSQPLTHTQIWTLTHTRAHKYTRYYCIDYTGFNARLQASLVVKSDGWTDITGWQSVGATNSLFKADGGINSQGRFYPSQQGVHGALFTNCEHMCESSMGIEHRPHTSLYLVASIFKISTHYILALVLIPTCAGFFLCSANIRLDKFFGDTARVLIGIDINRDVNTGFSVVERSGRFHCLPCSPVAECT